jgi:hypothetical protein
MFSDACDRAGQFTRRVILCWQSADGTCSGGAAAFIVLNADGWILSAAHLAAPEVRRQQSVLQLQEYDSIHHGRNVAPTKRTASRRPDKVGQELVRRTSFFWGAVGVEIQKLYAVPGADVMVAQLSKPELLGVTDFPTFKRSNNIRQGMSLVRLGYPFVDVKCSYNEGEDRFETELPEESLFAIEGILSRIVTAPIPGAPFSRVILETSSPGLMGQSGGPILDREGHVCAVQSETGHYRLGFNVKSADGKNGPEQFLNVGRGISTATIEHVFQTNGVEVGWSD